MARRRRTEEEIDVVTEEVLPDSGYDCWWCNLIRIVLGVLSLALAAALAWALMQPAKVAYQPVWCSDEIDSAAAQGASKRGTRRTSGGGGGYEPAIPSTSGMLPTISIPPIDLQASSAVAAQSASAGGGQRRRLSDNVMNRVKNHVTAAIAEADGSRIAYEMLEDDPVQELLLQNDDEREEARWQFEERSRLSGGIAGFYRLALTYLGDLAFILAKTDSEDRTQKGHDRLFVPFCPYGDYVPEEDDGESFAYGYLFWIEQCDVMHPPLAERWMKAIVDHTGWSRREVEKLEATWRRSFDRHVTWVMITNRVSRDQAHQLFCVGFKDIATEVGGGGQPPPVCQFAVNARQALKLGDAALAVGRIEAARECWRRTIELGRTDPLGAQAARLAAKRLQANTLTCSYTPESLQTISRDYRARSGDLIQLRVIQQALQTLGHYDGPLNGELDQVTRASIRKFQREMEFDETDTLNPFETTVLMCRAAENTGDVVSQNALGIMYAAGLGVARNTDSALEFLRNASAAGYPDATYNLAILYGTGIILNSYRLCDAPRSPEQAQQYLQEAAAQKHPIAMALMRLYGPGSKYADLTPAERWKLIESQQLENSSQSKTGLYAKLVSVGTKCSADRSIR